MPTTVKTYSDTELANELNRLPGWYHERGAICRAYRTDGWPATLMLVNAIGFVAEAADHHPDIEVSWGRVFVRLHTHSAGGVTDKDLELAGAIERTALWRPPAGGALTGTKNRFVRADDPARTA